MATEQSEIRKRFENIARAVIATTEAEDHAIQALSGLSVEAGSEQLHRYDACMHKAIESARRASKIADEDILDEDATALANEAVMNFREALRVGPTFAELGWHAVAACTRRLHAIAREVEQAVNPLEDLDIEEPRSGALS